MTTGVRAPFARDGLGEVPLNVRSVIELELFDRCSPGLPFCAPCAPLPLVTDDTEPLRNILLVCRLPTGSGVVVCDRKAAAAAADDRLGARWLA